MRLGAAALIFWFALAIQGQSAQRWRWSNPWPHGATVFDQASLGSFVAQACEFGQLYVSDDLDNWMPRPTGVTNSLRCALFFGGQLVVGASEGVIIYSEGDGMSRFRKVNLGTTDWIEGLALANGRLVGVGDNGAIYTSLNMTDWQRLPNAGEWLTSVAYGGGRFVAVGYEGYVITSTNGTTWSGGTRIGSQDLNKVAYLNDRFWIVGNAGFVRTSTNGLSWAALNVGTTNDLFGAAASSNEVVLVGRSELRVSSAPFTQWFSKIGVGPGAPPDWTYYTAHWDGAEFLVSGRSGIFVEGFRTNATMELSWVNNSDVPRNWMWSIINMDGIFAASGEGGAIFTSTTGNNFDQEVVPLSARQEILEGIGGNTNMLVAVGTGGVVLYSPGGFTNVVSTNNGQISTQRVSLLGLNWVAPTRPTVNELQGVGVFGPLYVISGGQGFIATSTNGSVWTPRISGATRMLSSVAASTTRVIAVGDFGALTTSDNGILWTARNSGVTNWIYQARYLNGQFVAVGEAGLIMTSPDGIAWTRRNGGTTVWLNGLTYAQGNYYAVGSLGTILKSSNAIDWTAIPKITSKSFYGVAANADTIVAAGIEGIFTRSRISAFPASVDFLGVGREGTGLIFLFSGELDQPFTIQKTQDFQTWSEGPDLEIIDGTGVLIHFEGLGRATRSFYRTSLLAP